jgi:hypothetical protein
MMSRSYKADKEIKEGFTDPDSKNQRVRKKDRDNDT